MASIRRAHRNPQKTNLVLAGSRPRPSGWHPFARGRSAVSRGGFHHGLERCHCDSHGQTLRTYRPIRTATGARSSERKSCTVRADRLRTTGAIVAPASKCAPMVRRASDPTCRAFTFAADLALVFQRRLRGATWMSLPQAPMRSGPSIRLLAGRVLETAECPLKNHQSVMASSAQDGSGSRS